jgi:hypothetical protein
MYGWSLFPDGKSRCYYERLFVSDNRPPNDAEVVLVTSVKLLIRNVQNPRNPCRTNPERMHLISEIPEPAAYLAKDWTRRAATKDNAACRTISSARVRTRK